MRQMVPVTTPAGVATVAELAREIWTRHYVPIIGQAQTAYMLATFQSPEAIAGQIDAGYEYYLAMEEGAPQGYFALVPDLTGQRALLSKIYVRQERQGTGLGKAMLAHLEARCVRMGVRELWLTVNRHNAGSIAFYRRAGFEVTGSLVQDIGHGFVMDDFRMAKILPAGEART